MSLFRKILTAFGLMAAAALPANAAEPKVVTDAVAAADWIAKALSSSGYQADFSVESLKEIDRFLEEQAPQGKAKPDGLLSEDLGSRLFALGAYVGETLRRKMDGQWQGDDQDPKAEINIAVKRKNGTVFWPVQRVMKRFKNGGEEGLHSYGIALIRP